jgi:hypothetical protein
MRSKTTLTERPEPEGEHNNDRKSAPVSARSRSSTARTKRDAHPRRPTQLVPPPRRVACGRCSNVVPALSSNRASQPPRSPRAAALATTAGLRSGRNRALTTTPGLRCCQARPTPATARKPRLRTYALTHAPLGVLRWSVAVVLRPAPTTALTPLLSFPPVIRHAGTALPHPARGHLGPPGCGRRARSSESADKWRG